MHEKVTPDVLEMYDALGVAHVPAAFDAAWISKMSALIDGVIAGLRSGELSFGPHHLSRDIEFIDSGGYVQVIELFHRMPEMRALIAETDCAEIVADVIASDTMAPWMDGTFIKEGDAPESATPWHNDECTFPLSGEHSPSMWVALTDVDIDNAPLQSLAGSHKDPHRYFSPFGDQTRTAPPEFHEWSELVERAEASDADIRTWEAKAGDMLVLHPKTIHASLPRKAGLVGRRSAFSLRWLGSDIRYQFNPTTFDAPFESSELLEEGEPLPEALFPITWRRAA